MTISIVARQSDGAEFGIAVSSSSPAVAARCSHARARVGAVASQNITDPALGAAVLDRLARGVTALEAVDAALAATPFGAFRQVLAVGNLGPAAGYAGAHALGVNAIALGRDVAAGGNLLAHSEVPGAMVGAFENTRGALGPRLLAALRAGREAGGEAGPLHSAGLLIVRELSWPIVDLRVDWHENNPIAALDALWEIYAPQMEDYVSRALDPAGAPSFGVPGDP